jgi:ABC-2 type transport system permease protein
MVQVLIFTLAAPFLGLHLGLGSLLFLLGAFILTSVAFAAMGFFFAWGMRSSAGFHAIMMVFLMPLWLLSGALFPLEKAPLWLHAVMTVNPVAHALVLVRAPFYSTPAQMLGDGRWLVALAVTLLWAGASLAGSMRRVERREKGVAPA